MEADILDDLKSLHHQATKERSHFYVGRVCERAFIEISKLRDELAVLHDSSSSAQPKEKA